MNLDNKNKLIYKLIKYKLIFLFFKNNIKLTMDGEQQPVYEQYPNYKDVRGVRHRINNNNI